MARLRISLANKCQLLFGTAVVLILGAALSVPWLRMEKLVDESLRQSARELADQWLPDLIPAAGHLYSTPEPLVGAEEQEPSRLRLIGEKEFDAESARDASIAEAIRHFKSSAKISEWVATAQFTGRSMHFRYIRAVRQSDVERVRGAYRSDLVVSQVADPLSGLVVVDMRTDWAANQLLLNGVYITIAGLLAGLLAIAVFWFITTRIILSPVRVLRQTTEKVADGDLNIRADINTGDEFEQLGSAFNTMLGTLRSSQDQLRSLNQQLDLKLGEMAEANVSLHEANRLKGEFLANVSHELRTPLHSIVGFAEVLADETDQSLTPDRRTRYVDNILSSSRSLLQMITELLDLAKIEAGRVDVNVEPMSVADACEGLLNLIRPQADETQIELALDVPVDVPVVHTDAGKFQQIIFNFLSNAVKFTPEGGRVTLNAMTEQDGVRVSVADTGPGIPVEAHEQVFEKFRQLDDSHTREHAGSGLGLAISRQLAELLNGRIELDSDVGRGAAFSLIIPMMLEAKTEPLMPDLTG